MQFCHINSHINYHLINKLFRDKLLEFDVYDFCFSWTNHSIMVQRLLYIFITDSFPLLGGKTEVTKYKGHNQQKISPINPKIFCLYHCATKDRIALCSITIQVHDRDDSTKGRGKGNLKPKQRILNVMPSLAVSHRHRQKCHLWWGGGHVLRKENSFSKAVSRFKCCLKAF